jgi:protein gp37
VNKQGGDGIAWTDWTLQLVRFRSKTTGRAMNWCQKISPGCASCYAERITRRFHGREHSYTPAGRELVEPYLDRAALRELVTTRRRGMCFVEDMSDLFGEWVPDEWLDECFAAFALSPLTIQILTKRADRMRAYLTDPEVLHVLNRKVAQLAGSVVAGERVSRSKLLPNVWLGVSVEGRDQLVRLDHLRETPAAVRFASIEPLLEDLGDIGPYLTCATCHGTGWFGGGSDLEGESVDDGEQCECRREPAIQWAIIGGESGPQARPCDVAWVRSLRDQCRAAGVACFVKQLGSHPVEYWCAGGEHCTHPDCGNKMPRLHHSHGGDPAEWPKDLRVRELPDVGRG